MLAVVVVRAERDDVVQVGRAAVAPVDQRVALDVGDRAAAGESAPSVPVFDEPAEAAGDDPL